MKRDLLETELKRVHVDLDGWLPVLQCDVCDKRWEPFASSAAGENAQTARLDYWICPNKCNSHLQLAPQAMTVMPRHVVINDIHGMIFGEADLEDFERYVRSMDATQVWNRPL